HLLLELGELRRDIALAARDGLLADVVPRHLREVRLRDLDVVTEHAVVADLEAGDAAVLLLAGLDREDLVLAAVGEPAARIDLGVVAGADRAALLDERRRIVDERAREAAGERGQRRLDRAREQR